LAVGPLVIFSWQNVSDDDIPPEGVILMDRACLEAWFTPTLGQFVSTLNAIAMETREKQEKNEE